MGIENSAQRSLVKPFEPSSCAAAFDGPNTLILARGEIVGKPGHQRHLGSDHDKADVVLAQKRDDGGVVGDVERHALGHLGDAGVAGRAIELAQQGAARKGPGQRMLAAAGADEEYVHGQSRPRFAQDRL